MRLCTRCDRDMALSVIQSFLSFLHCIHNTKVTLSVPKISLLYCTVTVVVLPFVTTIENDAHYFLY